MKPISNSLVVGILVFSMISFLSVAAMSRSPREEMILENFRRATKAYSIGAEIKGDSASIDEHNYSELLHSASPKLRHFMTTSSKDVLRASDAVNRSVKAQESRRWTTPIKVGVDEKLSIHGEMLDLAQLLSSAIGLEITIVGIDDADDGANVFIDSFGYSRSGFAGFNYFPPSKTSRRERDPQYRYCRLGRATIEASLTKCPRLEFFAGRFGRKFDADRFWSDGIIFTTGSSTGVDGFFAAKAGEIYFANCFVPLSSSTRVKQSLATECLLRVLGLPRSIDPSVPSALNPGIETAERRNNPLDALAVREAECPSDDKCILITQTDQELLQLLYQGDR